MENNKYDLDCKENLGHGIKGEINTDANDLKNDKKNANNKTTNAKNNKK